MDAEQFRQTVGDVIPYQDEDAEADQEASISYRLSPEGQQNFE